MTTSEMAHELGGLQSHKRSSVTVQADGYVTRQAIIASIAQAFFCNEVWTGGTQEIDDRFNRTSVLL